MGQSFLINFDRLRCILESLLEARNLRTIQQSNWFYGFEWNNSIVRFINLDLWIGVHLKFTSNHLQILPLTSVIVSLVIGSLVYGL
jgi:hypothetical protein